MALTNVTATITAGQSLSAPVNCSAGYVLLLSLPANWAPANLSFQISTDGGVTYSDLFDAAAKEILFNVSPGSCVLVPSETGINKALAWMKFRSGSRNSPVPQHATVSIAVALDDGKGPNA